MHYPNGVGADGIDRKIGDRKMKDGTEVLRSIFLFQIGKAGAQDVPNWKGWDLSHVEEEGRKHQHPSPRDRHIHPVGQGWRLHFAHRYAEGQGRRFFISDWLRNRNTVEFLGIWESVFNPDFNYGEFAIIRSQAGLNNYKISVKEWVEKTSAIGLKATAGRYGGTYAHPDIAFEFGMWISPEFKIYLVKEFRRLKEDENRRLSLAWDLNRTLSKLNYRIHTDAIKVNLIPQRSRPRKPRSRMPTRLMSSMSRFLGKPRSSGARPIPNLTATCATTQPWNSCSCWPISRA